MYLHVSNDKFTLQEKMGAKNQWVCRKSSRTLLCTEFTHGSAVGGWELRITWPGFSSTQLRSQALMPVTTVTSLVFS